MKKTLIPLGLFIILVVFLAIALLTVAVTMKVQRPGEAGVAITTFWAGYTGPRVWNFTEGPKTIGLVPLRYRAQRLLELKQAARFAAGLKLPSITTHVGFLPEDPNDADFIGTVDDVEVGQDIAFRRDHDTAAEA